MKFGVFIQKDQRFLSMEILKVFESAGLSYSNRDPEMAIVVGGEGTFGYYGKLHIHMLFVGISDNDVSGNKSNNGARFSDNKLGICHIIPTFLVRKLSLGNKKRTIVRGSYIRYTIPNQSIKISLTRDADVRLYGTTENSGGIAITSDDEILIRPSRRTAKIIRLDFDRITR